MSDEEKKGESDYQKAPEVPPEVRPLYEAVRAALAKELSVTEAASRAGLSRNRFQTLMHRGLHGLLEGISPKVQGRKPKPPREAELEAELERMKKENARLQARVETVDRLLGVASDLVRGKLSLTGRQAGAKTKAEGAADESDEPDGESRLQLEGVGALRALGLTAALAAALVGSSASTVRRHASRARDGQVLVGARGPGPRAPSAEQLERGDEVVREMRGLIGAEALAHRVPGLSRRQAAKVKQASLTAIERERREACERITVTKPGVVRGFDPMYVTGGFIFGASDGSIPYRTLLDAYENYDTQSVVDALERDVRRNGAPVVYRMDLAKSHRTGEVRELCGAHGILLLHGPPHHPQYYGQLERQNREHRAWLTVGGERGWSELIEDLERMKYAWNCALPRRSLGWRTASEVWSQRPKLEVDRDELREEVKDRAARIQRQLEVRGERADQAERFAIEAALTKRSWLVRQGGARC